MVLGGGGLWWGWDPGRLCTDSCRLAGILMGKGLKSSQHRGDTTELELEWNLKLFSSSSYFSFFLPIS